MSYKSIVSLLVNGEPVSAGVTNRPMAEIQGNVQYLKDLFEAAVLGSAQFAREVTVEAGAAIGMPVYFNASTQRFERAQASAYIDGTSGEIVNAPSSLVWGVVYYKHNSTLADLLIGGYAPLDISLAVVGTPTAGMHYLSGTTPGYLTQQAPPVSVPVLQYDGTNVLVKTTFTDFFHSHAHYQFELQCIPAGTHSDPGSPNPHTITSPDTDIEGWLPANHASFGGHAPSGATFGYNIAASPLANAWPPIPLGSVSLMWNRALDKEIGGTEVELNTPNPLCVIDQYGIWWMTDCYGDVPWLTTYNSAAPPSDPTPGNCPREMAMSMVLSFTKMKFQTANSVVTSLRSASNSPIIVRCIADGDETKVTGDLELDLDWDLITDPGDDAEGYLVLKELTDGTFFRGPVAEGAKSNSPSLTVVGTGPDVDDYKTGRLTFTFSTTPVGGEFGIEIVSLDGATEENYESTIGIGLPPDKLTSYRGKTRVPAELGGATAVILRFRFVFLMRADGDMPALTLTYRVIGRPGITAGTSLALPTSDISLTLSVATAAGMTEDHYIELESSTFGVGVGDQVLFTLSRNGESDAFADEVHVLDQRCVVVSVI